jgi:hypothetical protein
MGFGRVGAASFLPAKPQRIYTTSRWPCGPSRMTLAKLGGVAISMSSSDFATSGYEKACTSRHHLIWVNFPHIAP